MNRLNDLIPAIRPADEACRMEAVKAWNRLAKPLGSLGVLEEDVAAVAALTGEEVGCIKVARFRLRRCGLRFLGRRRRRRGWRCLALLVGEEIESEVDLMIRVVVYFYEIVAIAVGCGVFVVGGHHFRDHQLRQTRVDD